MCHGHPSTNVLGTVSRLDPVTDVFWYIGRASNQPAIDTCPDVWGDVCAEVQIPHRRPTQDVFSLIKEESTPNLSLQEPCTPSVPVIQAT